MFREQRVETLRSFFDGDTMCFLHVLFILIPPPLWDFFPHIDGRSSKKCLLPRLFLLPLLPTGHGAAARRCENRDTASISDDRVNGLCLRQTAWRHHALRTARRAPARIEGWPGVTRSGLAPDVSNHRVLSRNLRSSLSVSRINTVSPSIVSS